MTRLQIALAVVVTAEVMVGAWALTRRPAPPLPDLTSTDPVAAVTIRELSATVRTPEEWHRLGTIHLAFGFYPEAEACLRVAAAARPDDAFDHAFAVERLGLAREAADGFLRVAAGGHPRAKDAWFYAGRNALRLGDEAAARDAFARAGRQPAARFELARMDARAGANDKALSLIRAVGDDHPLATQPHQLAHRVALLGGDARAALAHADLADRLPERLPHPFDREWKRLGTVYESEGLTAKWWKARGLVNEGRLGEAAALLDELRLANWPPDPAEFIAEVALLQGRPREAVAVVEQLIARSGPGRGQLELLGEAHNAAGDAPAALAAWGRALDQTDGPASKKVHEHLARHFDRAGDATKAHYHRGMIERARGAELARGGKPAEAVAPLTQAADLLAEDAMTRYYLGEAYRLAGRREEARAAYESCLRIDPHFGRARRGLKLLE